MKVFKGFKNNGIEHQVNSNKRVFSSSPKYKKPKLTLAINDFMKSETFKLLMKKRQKEDEKSKETLKNDESNK